MRGVVRKEGYFIHMNAVKRLVSKRKGVFYGWWIVAAGTSLYFLGIGSVFYGFSAFFTPMVAEFGWSRAVTSGAYSLSRLEGGVEGPIIGWLIDKFGARKLIFIGVSLTGVGFMVLSRVNSALSLYLIFGLLVTMGFETGFFHATTTATANWFIKKRSRALSFITAGGGFGGAVLVPFLALMITNFGWRWASIVMGIVVLVVGLPLAYVIRSRPEDKGLLPDGEAVVPIPEAAAEAAPIDPDGQALPQTVDPEINFTVREAMKTGTFWTFVTAMMLRACILSAIVVHQIPHLVDVGISYEAAAGCLGTMILLSVPGRLLFGWLGDRFDNRYLLFVTSAIQAVGILIFIQVNTVWMAYLFAVIYALGYGGAIPLTLNFRGRLFGRKAFATLGGMTSALTAVAAVAAPVFAGYVFDVSGSYKVAFYTFLGMVALSGVIFLLIRYPKTPARLAGMVPGSWPK